MLTAADRERGLDTVRSRIERHDALVLPWIRLWRGMGYGPVSIAKLLAAKQIAPPRSRWSANAVRRIAERNVLSWPTQGIRSFVPGGLAAGLRATEGASLAATRSKRASDAPVAMALKAALLKGLDLLSEGRLSGENT